MANYHTTRIDIYPVDAKIYHDRDDRRVGREIEPDQRESGQGQGRKLCALCGTMTAAERSETRSTRWRRRRGS
jgi:hypothetical protein